MTHESSASDEIDIDEAMRLTGKSRATLMRWKRDKGLKTRTDVRVHEQRQRRLMFVRSEIEALVEDEPPFTRNAAPDGNDHSVTGGV